MGCLDLRAAISGYRWCATHSYIVCRFLRSYSQSPLSHIQFASRLIHLSVTMSISEKQNDMRTGTETDPQHGYSSASSIAGDINEKALLRKLDYRLLPLTILYLLSFLDRSNVGNARLEGMTDDVKMCTW